MGELTPSENEWVIMEVLWESETPLTASQIIEKLKGIKEEIGRASCRERV